MKASNLSLGIFAIGAVLMLLLKICCSQDIIKTEYEIEEETGVGIVVGNAGQDSGLYNKYWQDLSLLMFQPFAQGNEYISYFSVNSSNGVIRTARNIDRETICPDQVICTVKLGVAVYRKSSSPSESPSLLNILDISVNIIDINDNSPTFPSPVVTLPVPENLDINYHIETSVATDADEEGGNSKITYRLVPSSDLFQVSTVKTTDGLEDLVITIRGALDREDKSLYQLIVVATDLGDDPKSGSLLINIQVTDMNDNAPVFGKLNYSVNILENSDTSVPVVIVTASDRDEGENARLTYSFSFQVSQEIRDTFTLEPDTGKIFSKNELDYEMKQVYQFSVVVSDHGSPSRSNFAYVTINLIDVNDNMPYILINPGPGDDTIIEHGSVGKFLAYIKVTDADSLEYGQVFCDILDSNFLLEPVDSGSLGIYTIKLKQALDREEAPIRDVVISCQDGDINPMSSSASFKVIVEDINDNPPKFVEHFLSGSVMENGNDDSYVMQVVATDPDDGENSSITFHLRSGNDLFTINANTGVITTHTMLDREDISQHFLEITASDHGIYSLASTATVTVNVMDENDNPPRFRKQAYFVSIQENLPAGASAGNPSAYDDDRDENAIFVFSIVNQGFASEDGFLFQIDSDTGLLTTAISFNREDRSLYHFRIKVADPFVTSYYDIANVTVTIEDDNDHAPFIIKPPPINRTFWCPFNTTVGETITVFVATDEDDPKFVRMSYYIQDLNPSSNKWPLFSVDPTSGTLRLAREIRPDDVHTHTLEVVVADGVELSSQSSSVVVSIVVEEGSYDLMKAFIDGSKTNMVIVFIIIAATILLVIIIMAAICLIRRLDNKRRPQLPTGLQNINNKMYHAAKWVSSVSVTKDVGVEEVTSVLEVSCDRKKKKEVSFCVDHDRVDSPETNESRGIMLNMSTKETYRMDAVPFQLNTTQGDFIVMYGMSTPDYSQHLYRVTTARTDHKDENQFMEVRQADDRYSDASSGDTGTSDSGRGGSEDEGHGHANSSGDGELQNGRAGSFLSRRTDLVSNANSKKNNDTNALKCLKQIESSTEDDAPGSPTPLLSEKLRQTDSYRYMQRSYDKLPVICGRGSPSSANSSPSPQEAKQTLLHHGQHYHNSELSVSSHPEQHPRDRSKNQTQQRQQVLQTFLSPHESEVPSCNNSAPSWKKDKYLNTSWPSTSFNYDKENNSSASTDYYATKPGDTKDHQINDMLV